MTEIIAFDRNVRNDFIEHLGEYLSNKHNVKVERKGKKLIMHSEQDIRNRLIKMDIIDFLHKKIANNYKVHSLEDGTIKVKIFEEIRGEVKKTPKSRRYRGKYLCHYCGLDHGETIWKHIHTMYGGFH